MRSWPSIEAQNNDSKTKHSLMFLDPMGKIDRTGKRYLLLLVGALVIVCQLLAMALLADWQVKKAALRESQLTAQRGAMVKCFETSTGFDLQGCLVDVYVDGRTNVATHVGAGGGLPEDVSSGEVANKPPDFTVAALLAAVQGLLSASLAPD